MAFKFSIYAINFRTKSKVDSTFNYNFRFLSFYLVKDVPVISTLIKYK